MNILTIGGSDPSSGAGIQSDIRTFADFGAYGFTIITAITTIIYCSSLFYLVKSMQHDGAALSLVIRNLCILSVGTYFYFRALKINTN